MKQLIQNWKTGEIALVEVPMPKIKPGYILIKNHFSAVSIGTERAMKSFAEKNLIGKALARPDLTKKVLDFAKSEGLLEAYRQAMSRLDFPEPLGYSCAGEVVDVGEKVNEFTVGDKVACFGSGFASHSEVVCVPKNLCVKIPKNVSLEEACFTGIGAIALHSIRCAKLSFGERIAIIGLGLLGLIGVQIAKACNYKVFAIDVLQSKINLARQLGADRVATVGENIKEKINSFSSGKGVDSTIIFASTKSNKPIELAAEITREKGRIVVPGLVGLKLPRETFYHKELELIIPRATGPGAYDSNFELKGIDYPFSYVRWTEKENMKEFLDLLKERKINLSPLITHKFKLEEYPKIYETIEKDKSAIGIVIEYKKRIERKIKIEIKKEYKKEKKINVGLIGAGNFAKGTILPIISKISFANLRGVATTKGLTSWHAAKKFGFEYATTDYKKLLKDKKINTIVIATRHNLHAKLVCEALRANKNVFVEKPLALSTKELLEIKEVYEKSKAQLMVGFNRRFSPYSQKIKKYLNGSEPLIINIRVNAGKIAEDSWVYSEEGGGRILGEMCHFVDLIQYFANSYPQRVYALGLEKKPEENLVSVMHLENGSVGSIIYSSEGDPSFPRERIEIIGNNSIFVIDNFRKLTISRNGKKIKERKFFSIDRGHKKEFEIFFECLKEGKPLPVPFESYFYTTLATIAIQESLIKNRIIKLTELL